MVVERMKNASRNVIFGIILKGYQILVPFLMRTTMIYLMGMQYLGLNSLFISILQVLNLAELGVGSALVYSLYRPIVEDDRTRVQALMNLYRKYYYYIGLVIAVIGVVLTPLVPRLISGEVPSEINLYVLYLLNLGSTVLSYWLLAYKNSILQANQRADVVSKVTIITNTVQYAVQLLVLWMFRNYYLYVIVMLLTQVATNVVTALVADRMYPNYKPQGRLKREEVKQINQRIKDLFTAKLGTVFSTSVDNIIISAFLGLTVLATYQNYFYILNAVIGVVMVVFNSCTAGIGNSLAVESAEKNYFDFRKLAFLTIWICAICVSCFMCLYQPFMIVWVGDQLLLPDLMVVFLCMYFYLYVIQMLSCVYKDAAGIWHEDRFRPIIAGIVNLALNVTLVQFWGLNAIVLSTIISYLTVAVPWVIRNLFKLVFKTSPQKYILEIVKGALAITLIASICYGMCGLINIGGIIGLICRFGVVLIVSNFLFVLLYRKNEMFAPVIAMIHHLLNNMVKRGRHL